MATKSNTNQIILDIIQEGVKKGILHLNTKGEKIENTRIGVGEKYLVNFSSCSYLGLEHHPALKQGARDAIDSFGTQFSSSRAYISIGLYEELERLLSQIFHNNKTIVTATTTLGHIAAIPVLIEDGDAVLIDHQVHHSVQTAAELLRSKNVHIEMIRHNDMVVIERKINELKSRCKNIWYLADGVYSMFGDLCPVQDVLKLLNRYEQFRLYIDDAHGMSYLGKHGSGYVCSQITLHPRMVLATSLNKAFASGGGALIIPDNELHKKVRTCGSTLITSGPLQPGNLGAAIAAANIHLSDEIYSLQQNLHDKIQFTKSLLQNYELPLISDSDAAIFFVGVSVPRLGYRIVQQMMNRGFLVNLGIFPAVPIKNTGIRFTITTLHTYQQINDMVSALKEEFEKGLIEENVSREQIYRAFKKELPAERRLNNLVSMVTEQSLNLKTELYHTIADIQKEKWNFMFKGRGAFDWNNLNILENVFSNNELPEDNWEFDYIIVTDNTGNPVAATFTTTALWKDDMLAPVSVSEKIELLRKNNPYHLVSKITATGSLITEGEHVFINQTHSQWKNAIISLTDSVNTIHQKRKSNGVFLRDFLAPDETLSETITGNGYFRFSMPDTHIAELSGWNSGEDFFSLLNRKNKKNFKADVRSLYDEFEFINKKNSGADEINYWYRLYMQVHSRNLEINTFALPEKFFSYICKNPDWDINALVLKETGQTLTVIFSYKSGDTYIPTVIGMDYSYLVSHKIYKQSLYRLLLRAKELKCNKVHLGFGAGMEKKKMNCIASETFSFVHLVDSFNAEFIRNYKTMAV